MTAHRRMTIVCLSIGLVVVFSQTARATTLYVDASCGDDTKAGTSSNCADPNGPKLTIQNAIDAAINTDEIVVASGTYNEVINFNGKAITLRSANPNDPEVIAATIIDGTGLNNSVVMCVSGEGADTVLDGFTITGGTGSPCGTFTCGGGMNNDNSDPTVTNCTFTYNTADYGGGMYNRESAPTLTYCNFTANDALTAGGMRNNTNSIPTITHCTFSRNTAENNGGAIGSSNASSIAVFNCTFTANVATIGGGLYNTGNSTSQLVVSSTFTGNVARAWGAGIVGSNVMVINSILWGNCDLDGCYESAQLTSSGNETTVTHSCIEGLDTFAGNGNIAVPPLFVDADGDDDMPGTADDNLHLMPGSPCVDAGDNRAVPPDALDVDDDGNLVEPVPYDLDRNPRFVNDTCVDDVGQLDPKFPDLGIIDMGAYELPDDPTGDPDDDGITNCNDNCPTHPNPIQEDCDSDGRGDVCTIATCLGDLACADCNGNTIPDACDIDNKHSNDDDMNGRPDECQAILFVDAAAEPEGDGSSWLLAYTDLQDALAVAQLGDEIRVATGVYRPDIPGGDRSLSFNLASGVRVYGGYAGSANPEQPGARDIIAYESILCGDLNGDDGPAFENNAENSYHVVMSRGADSRTTLDGFTIRRGNADGDGYDDQGGGMLNRDGSPNISNCTFTANSAIVGGGMKNEYANVTLNGCAFNSNSAEFGGGMYNDNSNSTVTNCTFTYNNATEFGGGMENGASSPTLVGCTFDNNYAVWFGGGTYNTFSYPIFIDCDFWGNHSAYEGGAMDNWNGDVTVINCRFGGNSAGEFGGAMNNVAGVVSVVNSTFSGNLAGIAGGAIEDSYRATTFLTNCAFTRNRSVYGGAMNISGTARTTLSNCILWGNVGGGLPGEPAQIYVSSGDPLQIANSCIQGLDLFTGSGNIGTDPLFMDVDGSDGIAGTEDDDMRLRPGSPCVDAGDNSRLPIDIFDLDDDGNTTEPMPVDLLGDPRFVDDPCTDDTGISDPGFPKLAVVDMGAHERPDDTAEDPDGDGVINCDDNCPVNFNPDQEDCDSDGVGDICAIAQCNGHPDCEDCDTNGQPDVCDIAGGHLIDDDGNGRPDQCQHPIYVDDDAPLGGYGISWATAFRFLQDALAVARAGDEIRVAAGTYHPDRDESGNVTPLDRTATFRLANERTLRGGYKGCSEEPCNQELASQRDIAVYEAVLNGDLGGDDGPGFENNGENSYHIVTASGTDTTAVLDGFTITKGFADSVFPNNDGAGMYTFEGSPTVSNCTFILNSAEAGAAMSNNNDSSPIIDSCTFIRNTTLHQGGAIENAWYGSPKISRCTFIANSATGSFGWGGAINSVRCTPVITDCLFIGNSARRGGAIRHQATTNALVTNCTFIANSAQTRGGAITNWLNASPTLTSCILWGNSPVEIYNDDPTEDKPRVSYSNVQGGLGNGTIDGGGNISTDPQFVRNPDDGGDGWGDDPDTPKTDEGANDDFGDLRLQSGSLCLDAGDPSFIPAPGMTDLDGHPRSLCGRVDMGAYEFGIGDYDCSDAVDLLDFAAWEACMTGPSGGPYAGGCEAFDFQHDGDVDLDDYATFLAVFGL